VDVRARDFKPGKTVVRRISLGRQEAHLGAVLIDIRPSRVDPEFGGSAKIRYDDVQRARDLCRPLQEWVPLELLD
jgi:hypothetical protein